MGGMKVSGQWAKNVRRLTQNHRALDFGLDDQIRTLDNFIISCKVT